MAEQNTPAYEQRDVNGFWLLVALAAFLLAFALALLGAYWAWQANLQQFAPLSPVTAQAPPTPQPRLLVKPVAELEQFMQEKQTRLQSYGWADRERGIAHIPIEHAMQQLAADGLPRWSQPSPAPPGQKAREAYEAALHRGEGAWDARP